MTFELRDPRVLVTGASGRLAFICSIADKARPAGSS
jgi:hypothetical protein